MFLSPRSQVRLAHAVDSLALPDAAVSPRIVQVEPRSRPLCAGDEFVFIDHTLTPSPVKARRLTQTDGALAAANTSRTGVWPCAPPSCAASPAHTKGRSVRGLSAAAFPGTSSQRSTPLIGSGLVLDESRRRRRRPLGLDIPGRFESVCDINAN